MANTNPDILSAERASMQVALDLVSALWGGTETMRDAGKTYLPMHAKELEDDWKYRRDRSFLFNGFRRAVQFLKGKPFGVPVQMPEGTDERTQQFADSMNEDGDSIEVFAQNYFEPALADGKRYLLVEYPRVESDVPLTPDEIAAGGIRPYCVEIDPRAFLGMRKVLRGGKQVITQFRYQEVVQIVDTTNEFGTVPQVVVRVYEEVPDSIGQIQLRLFRRTLDVAGDAEWTEEVYPLSPIKRVPVLEYGDGEMPLRDLADLNIEHWQVQSDFANTTHITLVPQQVFTGVTKEELGTEGKVGPKMRIVLGNEAAKAFYLQANPSSVDSGLKILEAIENQMRIMGLDMLATKVMTATERTSDQSGADSDLASMVVCLSRLLGQALDLMHEWEGRPGPGIEPIINTEFSINTADATTLQMLLEAVKVGKLSQETWLTESKKRGALDDSVDVQEEIDRTDKAADDAAEAEADAMKIAAQALKDQEEDPDEAEANDDEEEDE